MTPINPIVHALTQAMSLAGMFQRMNLEREVIERQKHRDERNDQLQDLQTQLALATNPALEPLAQGQTTREASVQLDPNVAGYAGTPAATGALPVDPKETVEYGGKRYAVRGRQELRNEGFAAKLKEAQALNDITAQTDLQKIMLQQRGQVAIAEINNEGATERTDKTIKGNKEIAGFREEGDTKRTGMREEGETKRAKMRESGANARNDADNATSRANAQLIHGDKSDPNSASKKAARVELQKLEAEEYGDSGKKQGLHASMLNIGETLKSGKTKDKDGSERPITGQERTALQNKLTILKTRRDQIMRRKRELGFSSEDDTTPKGGTWEDFKKNKLGGKA